MPSETPIENLPAAISKEISGIPSALVPRSLKALDRLIGAGLDIPIAWLAQKKAKIDAQTAAYGVVEAAIADVAAKEASATPEIVQQAVTVLVRKSYRRQANLSAVGTAAVEDLQSNQTDPIRNEPGSEAQDIDEDWLNVFERFAEDASTERMQNLWGRVLAGEIRRPGRFSTRTLRFLSEFSQTDAIAFAAFAECAFRDFAPKNLVKPAGKSDIRDLIYLEANGLIQGASNNLEMTININENGYSIISEGRLHLLISGKAGEKMKFECVALTPLEQELIALLPGRDARLAARKVAECMRNPTMNSAVLGTSDLNTNGFIPIDVLWDDSND